MISRRSVLVSAAAATAFPSLARTLPTVGLTLPLTGVQAAVANELLVGYTAALSDVAQLRVEDDQSVAGKTAANMTAFANAANVIATTGVVGTPHAKEAMPIARASGLPVVGIRSGASELRDGSPNVFHLRASYEDEIAKVLSMASIYKKVGVLYSDDVFGKGVVAHAEKVASSLGCVIVAKVAVERNGSDVKRQTAAMMAQKEQLGCVLLALIQAPAMAAARELRATHNYVMPIFAMSVIATAPFALSKDPGLEGTSLVSPFPLARVAQERMAQSFRAKMVEAKREELIGSPAAFESYFYGSVLADALEHGGGSRAGVQGYLTQSAQLDVKQMRIRFDEQRVGFHYLNIVRKTGTVLRA